MSLQYYIEQARQRCEWRENKQKQRRMTDEQRKACGNRLLSATQKAALMHRLSQGVSIKALMEEFNVSSATVKYYKGQVFVDYHP